MILLSLLVIGAMLVLSVGALVLVALVKAYLLVFYLPCIGWLLFASYLNYYVLESTITSRSRAS